MLVIPALEKPRQKCHEFDVILGSIVTHCPRKRKKKSKKKKGEERKEGKGTEIGVDDRGLKTPLTLYPGTAPKALALVLFGEK